MDNTSNWTIKELETFFKNVNIPDHPVKLNDHETIVDPMLFVNIHLSECKDKQLNPWFAPSLRRLRLFADILQRNK